MPTLKAPFNFVPLNDKVYFPDWAEQISQDVPFSDGLTGSIDLEIEAKSRIFVRNGHKQIKLDDRATDPEYKSFFHADDGTYYIPGTSLKGAIRSVLEIMSFGKMSFVQNKSFGIRDLSNSPDGNFYRDIIKPENIHCGWLKVDNLNISIRDCGLPWRISASEIDRKLNIGLENFMKKTKFKDDLRTAKHKYSLFGNSERHWNFKHEKHGNGNRILATFDDHGDGGTIVVTGQPGPRKLDNKGKWTGKFYEFVFPDKIESERIVDLSVFNEFDTIHENSPDYKDFMGGKLVKGESIPVFFMLDGNNKVESMGLSYMYKYPAYNSVFNGMREDDFSPKKDMAECIFGKSDDESLRGRIQFGHAVAEKESVKESDETKVTLSTPHPSYYPLYLEGGNSWNSESVRIAGYKRYPTRNNYISTDVIENMMSHLKALEPGSKFKEKIRFHNLRKAELGAVLNAILFANEEGCFHSIGAAKPLGYGKVSIKVTSLSEEEINEYLNAFYSELEKKIPGWRQTDTYKELIAMAKGIPEGRETEFSYMKMSTNRDDDEFFKGKGFPDKKLLGHFTQIIAGNVPDSIYTVNVSASKQRTNFEKKLEEEKKKKEELKKKFEEAIDLFNSDDFINSKKILEEVKNKSLEFKEKCDRYFDLIYQKEKEQNKKEEEQKQKNQEEIKRLEIERIQSNGLKIFLEEKQQNGNYKISNFNTLKSKVEKWMKYKQANSLNDSEVGDLKETLSRLYDNSTEREKKQSWMDYEKGIWMSIKKWMPDKNAKGLFNEIIK